MRRCLVWALLALLLASGASFASFGQGGHGNHTLMNLLITRGTPSGTPDFINGTLYYVDYSAIIPDSWQADIINNRPNTGSASTSSDKWMDVLPNKPNVEVGYRDYKGDYIVLGMTGTDADGRFSYPLASIDFANVVRANCTHVVVNYTGSLENPAFTDEITYCDVLSYWLPMNNINFESCVPVFLIFGVLAAAMYASGNDPLKAFDISTPRLPSPKNKPMAGETRFFPGWKVQRQFQVRNMNDTKAGIKHNLRRLNEGMGLVARNGETGTAGLRALSKNYQKNRYLIEKLENAKELTVAQRSFLTEMIYLGAGDKRLLAAANVTKTQLQSALSRGGNSKELRGISRTMNERITNREVGKIKSTMRSVIAKYEKDVKKNLTESQKVQNQNSIKALQSLSMLTGSGDPQKPGIREANEQATATFNSSRRWAGLGSYEMLRRKPGERVGPMRTFGDKVGEFIAKTPGLRGEPATMLSSAKLMTRMHAQMVKGAFGAIAAPIAGKIGGATERTVSKMARDQGRVGTAGNGFEGMNQEIRSVVAELKRKKVITDEQAKRILKDSSDYLKLSERISGDKNLNKEQKIAQLKVVQQNYRGLIDTQLQPHIEKSLERQSISESGASEIAAKNIGRMGKVVEELHRNGEITREKAKTLVDKHSELSQKFSAVLQNRALNASEREKQLKQLQEEYKNIFDGLGGAARDMLSREGLDDIQGTRVGNLNGTINEWIRGQIKEKTSVELRKDLEDAKRRNDRTSMGEIEKKYNQRLDFEKKLEQARRSGDVKTEAEVTSVLAKNWADSASDIVGRRGTVIRNGKMRDISIALGVDAIEAQTLTEAREKINTTRNTVSGALGRVGSPNDEAGRKLVGQLRRTHLVLDEMDANLGVLEKLKGSRDRRGKEPDTFDTLREEGYINRQSVAILNKWLELGRGRSQHTLTKTDVEKLKAFAEDLASELPTVMRQKRERTGAVIEYAGRRKLESRLEQMFKEGKTAELEDLAKKAAFGVEQVGPDGRTQIVQIHRSITNMGPAIRTDPKDFVNQQEFNTKLKEIMSSRDDNGAKAARFTSLMVETLPWHRKKQQEYAETIIRALEVDSKAAARSPLAQGLEDKNYLAINMRDANRRLRSWLVSNEEILERGFMPGGPITQAEALRSGAWIQNPEARWIPATATKPKEGAGQADWVAYETRRRELRDYVQNNLAGADRIVLGQLDPKTGEVVNKERSGKIGERLTDIAERSMLSGLFDMGYESLKVRANITQTWQTLDFLRDRYMEQEMWTRDGRVIVPGEVQARYMRDAFRLRSMHADLDAKVYELKQERKTADDEERKRIDETIKNERRIAEEEMKMIRTDMRTQKSFIHAIAHEPSVADVWKRFAYGTGENGATETGRPIRNLRDLYASNIEDFDPEMAHLSRRYSQDSYGTMFMGIIGVRSGRAMSSLFDVQGYIATGQALWGSAVMEPRRNNWVGMEWSEADVAWATYPGASFQDRIPFARHLTYGNFLRTMATPAIMANQPIAAAMKGSILAAEGIPGSWEPQYQYNMDWKKGVTSGLAGIATFSPFRIPMTALGYGLSKLNVPVSTDGYSATNLNPARDGWFARSTIGKALHWDDIKYELYSAYSKHNTSYALEGKTDTESFSAGGPILRMGNIDQYYMADYGGGYQPMFSMSPFVKRRTFPSWVANMNANAPGLIGGHFDMATPEIFRRETSAAEHFAGRAGYEHLDQYGRPKESKNFYEKIMSSGAFKMTTPGFVLHRVEGGRRLAHRMSAPSPESAVWHQIAQKKREEDATAVTEEMKRQQKEAAERENSARYGQIKRNPGKRSDKD